MCEMFHMQGSSKALAPAGIQLEDYIELKRLADSLRRQHLADSDASSRCADERCLYCSSAVHLVMTGRLHRLTSDTTRLMHGYIQASYFPRARYAVFL